MNKFNQREQTQKLTMCAILTALVIIFQYVSMAIRAGGLFSITLSLVPIVIGAALYGRKIGAWLGLVFGVVVLISGDAGPFWAINIPGTIITVLGKGILCGTVAGLVYKLFAKKNKTLAIFLAAIVCPIVNTGVFLLGCFIFFLDAIKQFAAEKQFTTAIEFMITFYVGFNFIIEMIVSIVLNPVIKRILLLKGKIK